MVHAEDHVEDHGTDNRPKKLPGRNDKNRGCKHAKIHYQLAVTSANVLPRLEPIDENIEAPKTCAMPKQRKQSKANHGAAANAAKTWMNDADLNIAGVERHQHRQAKDSTKCLNDIGGAKAFETEEVEWEVNGEENEAERPVGEISHNQRDASNAAKHETRLLKQENPKRREDDADGYGKDVLYEGVFALAGHRDGVVGFSHSVVLMVRDGQSQVVARARGIWFGGSGAKVWFEGFGAGLW